MKRTIVALAWALTLCCPVLAQAPEKPDITVSIGTWSLGYLTLPIAQVKGYYKEEGLNVTIQNFNAGGTRALQALIGGSTDFVQGFYEHTLNMAAQGKNIRCVILMNTLQGNLLGVRKDLENEIKTVADLKGRKVGITALGSGTEFMLRLLMKRAGLGPRDVTMVAVGTGPSSIAAIEQKSVDAEIASDPAATILEDRGLVKTLLDARTVEGNAQVYGGDYPTICAYTTVDFIEKNPNTVQRLVNAYAKALRWIKSASPADIVAALPPEYIIGDKVEFAKMIERSMPMFTATGQFNPPDMERVRDVIGQFNDAVKNAKIEMSGTYTNRFIDAAPK